LNVAASSILVHDGQMERIFGHTGYHRGAAARCDDLDRGRGGLMARGKDAYRHICTQRQPNLLCNPS
jgi:hypothetical protein